MEKRIKKSAFVAIVGRPSTGKSSLMNNLCGEMVSIVTPVPQTTRNRIRGIMNSETGQIVFLDTPGFHCSERTFNKRLRDLISGSLKGCDCVLYVVDVSRSPGIEEKELISVLASSDLPCIIAYNKIDLCPAHAARKEINRLFNEQKGFGSPFRSLGEIETSAIGEDGMEELKRALFNLAEESGESGLFYPEDLYTDQDPEFRISEIIREQAMLRAREELPHAIRVEIQDIETRNESQLWVRAYICVESNSQIGLVVGKNGEGIRDIRRASQKKIGKVFPYRVHLDLRVKCSKNWRRNEGIIKRIIQ